MAWSGEGMRWQQQQGSPGVRPVFRNAPLLPNDFMCGFKSEIAHVSAAKTRSCQKLVDPTLY